MKRLTKAQSELIDAFLAEHAAHGCQGIGYDGDEDHV
jgi:hypothetical protein